MAINDTPRADTLAEKINTVRETLTRQAGTAMRDMATVATSLDLKEATLRLKKIANQLESDQFNLIIAGRFKNGKSTLMNSLLGRSTHPIPELANGHGPMPVDDLPATATLTSICYAEHPYVRVWYIDGKHEDWSLTRYLRDAVVKDDNDENKKFFGNIRQFELGFPAELCKSGITMFDSPGLNDTDERDLITRQAIYTADAAIVVFSSRAIGGMDEMDFARNSVMGTGTRIFIVVNMFDGRAADERFKAVVWNKLVKEMQQGPTYAGQDLQSRDIYFVDAGKAEKGKMSNNPQLVAESGLALFETHLGNFLLKERYYTHLQKFLYNGITLADSIVQHIDQRRAAIEQDEQKLQQAFKEIEPKLASVRTRREKLPTLIARYRTSCQRDVSTSFEQMIVQLRLSLPATLMNPEVRIPSMRTGITAVLDQFRQKKLCQEATDLCNQIVSNHIKTWSEHEVPKILQPRLESLFDEISDEVAQIARTYDDMHLRLTGWRAGTSGPGGVVGTTERVLAGIAGIFVGDFTVLIGPAGGGWRSLAGALAGNIGTHVILGILGVSSAVIFWPAIVIGMVGSLLWGSHGLETRIKKKTLEFVLPELQNVPAQMTPKINAGVGETFTRLEQAVMEQVMTVINEEERNIQTMMDLNKRSRSEKTQALALLIEANSKVVKQRQALKELEVKAKQLA